MQTQLELGIPQPNYLPKFNQHNSQLPTTLSLIRAFHQVCLQPQLFSYKEEALSKLGTTWSRCQAIKYFLQFFKLCVEDKGCIYPTAFGHKLLNSWDCYLENPVSVYLLHWYSLQSPCFSPSLWYLFCQSNSHEFTKEELLSGLKSFNKETSLQVADSSIGADCNWLIKAYSNDEQEQIYSCLKPTPKFLHSIKNKAGKTVRYVWDFKVKPDLDPVIVLATSLDFIGSKQSIPFEHLAYNVKSPGKVFKLRESTLEDVTESVITSCGLQEAIKLQLDPEYRLHLKTALNSKSLFLEILDNYYALSKENFQWQTSKSRTNLV